MSQTPGLDLFVENASEYSKEAKTGHVVALHPRPISITSAF